MQREKLDDKLPSEIIKMVAEATVIQRSVTENDEVYYQLRIYGDPLYELLTEIASRYHTDFSALDLRTVAPGEGASLWKGFISALGGKPFKSFKVADIIAAVRAGNWQK